jgi:hypothetical protein
VKHLANLRAAWDGDLSALGRLKLGLMADRYIARDEQFGAKLIGLVVTRELTAFGIFVPVVDAASSVVAVFDVAGVLIAGGKRAGCVVLANSRFCRRRR